MKYSPLKLQKYIAVGLSSLSLVSAIALPYLPISLLLGAVSLISGGFAYSLTINTSKILAARRDIASTRLDLRHKIGQAEKAKLNFEETQKRIKDAALYESDQLEKKYADSTAYMQADYERKLGIATRELEKEFVRKTKEFRKLQTARLAYLWTEKEKLEEYLQSEWTAEVEQYKGAFQEFEQVLAGFDGQLKEAQTEFRTSFQAKSNEVKALHHTLSRANNVQPFRGSDKASLVGNRLLDFFLKQGITLDAERCESKLDSSIIWVRPRGTTAKALNEHMEALQLEFELLSLPVAEIDKGCIRIKLVDAAIELPKKIVEPSIDRFKSALLASNHIRLTAPTDSGKSTLLDNILGFYDEEYASKQGLTLLDPKYPFTPWSGHTPDFKGFEECLGAMNQLKAKIDGRLKEARQLADANKAIPDYEPELFAIDELELLYADALSADGEKKGEVTKSLIKAINSGLKMGRGLTKEKGKGIKVLYVTQSPLCSKIGQNKDAFDQSTSIYLGSNISIVLQDGGELDGKITGAKRKALEKEYAVRIAAKQDYIMLVRLPNGGDVFLMECPKPGIFQTKKKESETTEGINSVGASCPSCGTVSTAKNGKYKGRQRYRCLNGTCSKKTFTEDK